MLTAIDFNYQFNLDYKRYFMELSFLTFLHKEKRRCPEL